MTGPHTLDVWDLEMVYQLYLSIEIYASEVGLPIFRSCVTTVTVLDFMQAETYVHTNGN